METTDYRMDCTLAVRGWRLRGVARVVEVAYSEHIRFCNFVLRLSTDQLDGAPAADVRDLVGDLVMVDGRAAVVRVTHLRAEGDHFEMAGAGTFA